MSTHATETPRVWIGCLASYNAGRLIGEWVDATDVDEMYECRDRVAAAAWKAAVECGDAPIYFGPPEEFFLADNEGFGFNPGEYPDWGALATVGALVEQHGSAFRAFLSWIDEDPLSIADELEDRFGEAYCGEADSEQDAAREMVSELGFGELPAGARWTGSTSADDHGGAFNYAGRSISVDIWEALDSYLDWESIARALFDHGSYALVDGIVFRESY
jgi:antirestriction protein